MNMERKKKRGWRANLLWFADATKKELSYLQDGLLITAEGVDGVVRIEALGAYQEVRQKYCDVSVTHWPDRCIAPGFIDLHVHYSQTDVIASPAQGLLPWLEQYTFPHEKKFSEIGYASSVARYFLDELQRNGVTTALCFATSHVESVDALMEEAQARRLRMITGKVLQDRFSPEGLRDVDTAQSLQQTQSLIEKWHKRDRLGYAVTPRFAPTSSERQLRGCGELAQQYPDVWVQSHAAENKDEIRWVKELYPKARSYIDVYDQAGLLRPRAIYAHCVHIDGEDRDRLAAVGASIACSPTSNLFLGSGFFDFAGADEAGVKYGLASDVGGGTSFSPFITMHAAYTVALQDAGRRSHSLSPHDLWWMHTAGAAQCLGLDGIVGNLLPGCEADFVVINPSATELLKRRTTQADSLEEWLFAMIVLGDDRLICRTIIQGEDCDGVGQAYWPEI